MRMPFSAFLMMAVSHPAFGQLPNFHNKVSRVSWVDDDLNKVTEG